MLANRGQSHPPFELEPRQFLKGSPIPQVHHIPMNFQIMQSHSEVAARACVHWGSCLVHARPARRKNRAANLNDCHPFGRDRCCARHSLESACWVRTDHAQEKSRRSRWRSTSLPAPRRAAVAAQWVCLVAMPARIQRQSGGTSPRAGHQHTRHRLLRSGCQWHATQALR